MIRRLWYCETEETCPFRNQALEEYLLEHVEREECILYLWQNRQTVVIGRNQNAWQELNVRRLETEGGFVARRLSGGGAVFHDLGNLNFTFLCREGGYDLPRQMQVILSACRQLGIRADLTGRNDICVDGRKVSGNAFYRRGDRRYHHGTLLLHTEVSLLERYLTVPEQKLRSKGVASVRARVANLTDFCPGLTAERMKEALREAFGKVYGGSPERLPLSRAAEPELEALEARYASPEWRLGSTIPFSYEVSHRFAWGEVTLQFQVEDGKIARLGAYSDAMREDLILALPGALTGRLFSAETLADGARRLDADFPDARQEIEDIATLLQSREI